MHEPHLYIGTVVAYVPTEEEKALFKNNDCVVQNKLPAIILSAEFDDKKWLFVSLRIIVNGPPHCDLWKTNVKLDSSTKLPGTYRFIK